MKKITFNHAMHLLSFFLFASTTIFCLDGDFSFTNSDALLADQVNTDLNSATEYNQAYNDQIVAEATRATHPKKEWTFITYMAADNDLAPFARKNLREQADVGSTPYINVVTQLDTRVAGNKKVTKRYYIEKDKLIITNQNDPNTQRMDSGLPATLIDCCKWAITNFPAKNYVLVL